MYERNATLIDKYFASLFGYDQTNNLKNNSSNYFELVNKLEEYQIASENENDIMTEFEKIANRIKETRKLQEVLNKRSIKFNENRKALFENLDEDDVSLRKKFDKVEVEISKNNEEIKQNTEKFIEEIKDFNEKSETRSIAGRERKNIESDYRKDLNNTTENFSKINVDKLKEIKAFVKSESKDEEKEKIKEKVMKNGEKEKIPFALNAINKAIDASLDIEQKRVEVLLSLYDKTTKLLEEIKNDTVKVEKHKKIVKDSKSKLEFLNVISEYIILFLDNERMNIVGGEKEHQKIMTDACENMQKDLAEIQNLYSLLIKEATGKATKKTYKDLYNLEYLYELQENEKKFEQSISKINMIGTVIYPDYWRIEGMQKIYDTIDAILTNTYEKDLTEFKPLDITCDVNDDILNMEEGNESKENENNKVDDTDTENNENQEEVIQEENSEENQEFADLVERIEAEEEKEEAEAEEVFKWEDDDENDELNFGVATDIEDDDEEEIENIKNDENIEEDDEEDEVDKEIDQLLGFFDEDEEDDDDEEEESLKFDIDEEDENDEDVEEEKENSETEEQEVEEKEKSEKKKVGLFGRRKK